MHRHLVVVVENWKFENWHLYHYQVTGNAKGTITWMEWKKIF